MKSILFNTDMVRAILAGKKTQTRRVCKVSTSTRNIDNQSCYQVAYPSSNLYGVCADFYDKNGFWLGASKPAYQPGDILYVRERFCVGKIECGEEADGREALYVEQCGTPSGEIGDYIPYEYCVSNEIGIDDVVWQPSIHMPKEAARIFLRVTRVRVERLNSITEEEAFKEGYRGCETEHTVYHVDPPEACWNVPDCPRNLDCLRLSFAEMFGVDVWDKTIKPGELDKYGWYANPWVWVIEFERFEKEKTE